MGSDVGIETWRLVTRNHDHRSRGCRGRVRINTPDAPDIPSDIAHGALSVQLPLGTHSNHAGHGRYPGVRGARLALRSGHRGSARQDMAAGMLTVRRRPLRTPAQIATNAMGRPPY